MHREKERAMSGRRLQLITGWGLLLGAVGIFVDAWAGWALSTDSPEWLISVLAPAGLGEGSIGLIPAYLGVTAGLIGFVIFMYRTQGARAALLAGVGVVGLFIFWYSYPARATFGGVGSIIIGSSMLLLPGWGRLASPLWVASGIMGIPELVRPGIHWGPVAGFTLAGAAVAVTGASVLWGSAEVHRGDTAQTLAQPAS
jgi:hypothetical protein